MNIAKHFKNASVVIEDSLSLKAQFLSLQQELNLMSTDWETHSVARALCECFGVEFGMLQQGQKVKRKLLNGPEGASLEYAFAKKSRTYFLLQQVAHTFYTHRVVLSDLVAAVNKIARSEGKPKGSVYRGTVVTKLDHIVVRDYTVVEEPRLIEAEDFLNEEFYLDEMDGPSLFITPSRILACLISEGAAGGRVLAELDREDPMQHTAYYLQ